MESSSGSESSDAFAESITGLDADVIDDEGEGLVLRSGQVVQRPPRPRGLRRCRVTQRDNAISEVESEDPEQVITEAEEMMTGAVVGAVSEIEVLEEGREYELENDDDQDVGQLQEQRKLRKQYNNKNQREETDKKRTTTR